MAVQTKSSTYVNLVNMTATQTSDPISGTIVPVQAAMKSYSMVKANTELGDTFHAAGSGLHLIYEALSSVKSRLPPEISNASLKLLDSCKAGATSSEAVFKEVSQAPSDTRLQSYTAFIKEGGRPNLVETLVGGLMKEVCLLAEGCAVEVDLTALRRASDELEKMEPSVPIEQHKSDDSFSNSGSGSQYNSTGGTQNNATGNGKQFFGATFQGAVSFS